MILKAIVASLVALGAATPVISLASEGWRGQAETPHYKGDVFPPWQKGENNDAVNRGFEFTIPEVNSLADFHGDITDDRDAPPA